MESVKTSTRWRTGVGRVELVPEPAPRAAWLGRLVANLATCRWLVIGVVLAQIVDVITTQVALRQPGYFEANGVMRPIVSAGPAGSTLLKVGAVLAVVSLALLRLPTSRARVAVGLALALSLLAPVANLATMLGD